jgi:hypothetical protein
MAVVCACATFPASERFAKPLGAVVMYLMLLGIEVVALYGAALALRMAWNV